ncbi:MAG: GGDEF domain-containing protein [Deltaproteobacteria bacterium]|nr:GGDEF domain-containing protein [Deltaproteobacteria bacterium]
MSWDDVTSVNVAPIMGEFPPDNDEAFLLVLAGTMIGEMYRVGRERTIVGRGQKADIRILDDGISREHCEIVMEHGHPVLRDLQSTNGTLVKGGRVETHRLQDGDKILVGSNTILKFTYHDHVDVTFARQMYESALRDDLTKAFNKKYFMDRLESEFSYSQRHHIPLTLVGIDIDHFKQVNDTYGHPFGDAVLTEVAARIFDSVRVEDVFARTGGEEFSVICRGTDGKQGLVAAERIRNAVNATEIKVADRAISVSVSVGLASVPGHGIKHALAFMTAVDEALYSSKNAGRNRTSVFKK